MCIVYFPDFNFSDMESARCPQPKLPSPTSSVASKGEPKVSPVNEGTTNVRETVDDKMAVSAPPQTSEQVKVTRVADVSEATHESMSVKEPASQGSTQLVEEEVQQKMVPTEAGNVDCLSPFFFWEGGLGVGGKGVWLCVLLLGKIIKYLCLEQQ